MKYFTLYTILFLLITSCGHDPKKDGAIKVVTNCCKYDDKQMLDLEEFVLLKNNIEIKTFSYDRNGVEVNELYYGDYEIKYKSIFNKYEKINFKITDHKQKLVPLCIDKIDYKKNDNILLLDEMKYGEILSLSFESQGCFHNTRKEIRLKKTENGLILFYDQNVIELTDKQYKLIREFEIELKSNHNGLCSSKDEYNLYNEQSHTFFTMKDESCTWNGFWNLIRLLKLDEGKTK